MPNTEATKTAAFAVELNKHGLKATKARLAVLACLAESKRPLTPKELLQRIEQDATKGSKIDQVSIYRILEAFDQLELVHHVQPNRGYLLCKHRRCHAGQHVLTYCQTCGEANEQEVPFEVLGPLLWYLKTAVNFQPKDHFFQMAGYCATCQPAAVPPPPTANHAASLL